MIYDLHTRNAQHIGNKAKCLIEMKNNGFQVPDGFVLSSRIYNDMISYNGQTNHIQDILRKLEPSSNREIELEIEDIFRQLCIPSLIADEIAKRLNPHKKYAVRSSSTKEDLETFSFAGQYSSFLNVSGIEEIKKAVIACYQSMFSHTNLSYLTHHKIDVDHLEMPVIIQEMVNADKSGIGFTINPLTGNDREMVVEIAEGLGENIVSGKVKPQKYLFNWFDQVYDFDANNHLLTESERRCLMEQLLNIQIFFGYPCDVEFAFEAGKLYILQARPISRIIYANITDEWTTANFKDGGVSSTACKPFMWSLYEYVWEVTFKRFLLETRLFKEKEMRKLGDMFYGRPYWNLSMAKGAMAKIPGYKEREFDNELGVRIVYEGDGQTTKITPKSILNIIWVALAQRKLTQKQNDNVRQYRDGLLEKIQNYTAMDKKGIAPDEIENIWMQLVKTDYLHSEGTYFFQIFINTIHQPLVKQSLLKYVSSDEYLNLISGLKNVSHLLPFYDIWEISRKIMVDKDSLAFWCQSDAAEIKKQYDADRHDFYIQDVKMHISKFGYHSERELDVSYPCYFEDVEKIIQMIKDTALLDESYSPGVDTWKQYQNYQTQLEKIQKQVSSKKYAKILKKLQKLRSMLWWREEFKDVSTYFYCLIRIFTKRLAVHYCQKGILDCEEDIWFIKIGDLFAYMEKRVNAKDLHSIIDRNKKYFASFRNFRNENEIGSVFDQPCSEAANGSNRIVGTGCSNGVVTGIARVILDITEIDQIERDDILVTKFTDTGWTSKFAILKGIVTEHGGILCHAAIVSREYGIPCIVSCNDVTKKIQNGSKITINGTTGVINHEEEVCQC